MAGADDLRVLDDEEASAVGRRRMPMDITVPVLGSKPAIFSPPFMSGLVLIWYGVYELSDRDTRSN